MSADFRGHFEVADNCGQLIRETYRVSEVGQESEGTSREDVVLKESDRETHTHIHTYTCLYSGVIRLL